MRIFIIKFDLKKQENLIQKIFKKQHYFGFFIAKILLFAVSFRMFIALSFFIILYQRSGFWTLISFNYRARFGFILLKG